MRCTFDGGTAVGFLALHDADDGDNFHAGLVCGLDGVDGRGAGGADVVHDHDARAFPAESFDATTGAVGLFGFADKKAMQQRRSCA